MAKRWKISLDEKHKKIVLWTGRINERRAKKLKEVPGRRYDWGTHTWRYPLDYVICQEIRRVVDELGLELKIDQALWDWAKAEKAKRDERPDLGIIDAIPLPRVEQEYPKLYMALAERGFQTVGAKFVATTRRVLIADPPGLGKTATAIAAAIEVGITGPILVVAPRAAARVTWPHEIRKWVHGEKFGMIGAHLSPEEREQAIRYVRNWCAENPDRRFWVITQPNYLRIRATLDKDGNFQYEKGQKLVTMVQEAVAEFYFTNWSAVIVDEAHQTLAGATANLKRQSSQRLGLGALQIKPDGLWVAISGTPFRGKPENIWGILNWLRPRVYTAYHSWCEKHFNIKTTTKTFYKRGVKGGERGEATSREFLGVKDEQRLFEELSIVMIRRSKSQVAPNLPPKMYAGTPLQPEDPNSPVAVWIPMTAMQRAAYKKLLAGGATLQLEGGELQVNHHLAQMTRLKQFANSYGKMEPKNDLGDLKFVPDNPSNKIDWILEWLQERGIGTEPYGDEKVIIASQFTSFIGLLSRTLKAKKIEHHRLTGATSDYARQRMVMEFQAPGGPRVFLLNSKAGGVSLTLDAADDLIVCDTTGDPDLEEQLEDRLHRISRVHNVTIWILASLGSIDEALLATQNNRELSLRSIIDSPRGVEFVKLVWDYMSERLR